MRRLPLFLSFLALAACGSTRPATESDRTDLDQEVQAAIRRLKAKDGSIGKWFDDAHGYAVFPQVGKGGLIVGAAFGRGQVYEGGALVGYATMSQGTIGAQIGGQSYVEVIFFKDETALRDFQRGNYEVGAQVSAVAVTDGASKDAGYNNGVAIFTMANGGLMAEASVGGQKFDYESK